MTAPETGARVVSKSADDDARTFARENVPDFGRHVGKRDDWIEVYEAAFQDAVTGNEAVFYSGRRSHRHWDDEQELPIFFAVGRALRCPGLSDHGFRAIVMETVKAVAHRYATQRADEAAQAALRG